MRKIFFIISAISLIGCSSFNSNETIPYSSLDRYIENNSGLLFSTPKDNLYSINVTCFKTQNDDKKYIKSFDINILSSIGEKIQYQYKIERPDQKPIELSINYDFLEDDNGEYFSHIDFFKQELLPKEHKNIKPSVLTSSISQDFYPENKVPYRFFVGKDMHEICYVTTRW